MGVLDFIVGRRDRQMARQPVDTAGNSMPELLQRIQEQQAQRVQQTWQRPVRNPNFMDFVIGGQDRVDSFRDRQQQQYDQQDQFIQKQWQNEQQGRLRNQWGRDDRTAKAMEDWLATLSPQDQATARADPEAYYAAYLKQQQAGVGGYEWKDGGTFNPQTGAWDPNESYWANQRRLRSIGGASQSTPPLPSGFVIDTDN